MHNMTDLPYFIIHGDLTKNCKEETEIELEYIDPSNPDNNFSISTTCVLAKNQITTRGQIILTDEMIGRLLFTNPHRRGDQICIKKEVAEFNEMERDECMNTMI